MITNQKLAILLKDAKKLQNNSYAPYSNFRVASIVILKNNQKIIGVNVENAAYPVTICAERNALSQVIAQGYNKDNIEALFLITDSTSIGSPCGVCRQVMSELMNDDSIVYIANKYMENIKDIKKIKVEELLPLAFNNNSLKD